MGKGLVRSLIAYLDTHAVVWLCEGRQERFPVLARTAIEESELLISPMVLLELQYLFEIERIIQHPQRLLNQLESQIGLKVCHHAFPSVIQSALFESWTRDPFDRVIVSHARSNGYAPLVTADEKIRQNYTRAVW